MSQKNDDFIIEKNIRRYRHMLETESDPETRATLRQLLREEQAKRVDPLPGPGQSAPRIAD